MDRFRLRSCRPPNLGASARTAVRPGAIARKSRRRHRADPRHGQPRPPHAQRERMVKVLPSSVAVRHEARRRPPDGVQLMASETSPSKPRSPIRVVTSLCSLARISPVDKSPMIKSTSPDSQIVTCTSRPGVARSNCTARPAPLGCSSSRAVEVTLGGSAPCQASNSCQKRAITMKTISMRPTQCPLRLETG
jgi:hypothetical protein